MEPFGQGSHPGTQLPGPVAHQNNGQGCAIRPLAGRDPLGAGTPRGERSIRGAAGWAKAWGGRDVNK
jgi:hypothetical protein